MAIRPISEPVPAEPLSNSSLPDRPVIVSASKPAQSRNRSGLDRGVEKAKELFCDIRDRVRYTAEHYPLQLIAGLATVAFATGVILRIRRSSFYARNQYLRKWRA